MNTYTTTVTNLYTIPNPTGYSETMSAPATVLFTSTTSPTIQFSLDCNV